MPKLCNQFIRVRSSTLHVVLDCFGYCHIVGSHMFVSVPFSVVLAVVIHALMLDTDEYCNGTHHQVTKWEEPVM